MATRKEGDLPRLAHANEAELRVEDNGAPCAWVAQMHDCRFRRADQQRAAATGEAAVRFSGFIRRACGVALCRAERGWEFVMTVKAVTSERARPSEFC